MLILRTIFTEDAADGHQLTGGAAGISLQRYSSVLAVAQRLDMSFHNSFGFGAGFGAHGHDVRVYLGIKRWQGVVLRFGQRVVNRCGCFGRDCRHATLDLPQADRRLPPDLNITAQGKGRNGSGSHQ